MYPPLFCPQNIDFVIFMQFLVILRKLFPTIWPHLRNPVGGGLWALECLGIVVFIIWIKLHFIYLNLK